jgi:N-acetylneuraminic acid mutarotase
MKPILLLFISLLWFSCHKSETTSNSTHNLWTQHHNLSDSVLARYSAVGFSIKGKGYITTGRNFLNKSDLWEFDTLSKTWTQRADFAGQARNGAVSFVIDHKAYVGLGEFISPKDTMYLHDFWYFHPDSNKWFESAPFKGVARSRAVAFVLNNKAYIGTGKDSVNTLLNDFWEYDAPTNLWTKKQPFAGAARYDAVAFVVKDKAYVGTGGNRTTAYSDIWEYDSTHDRWTQKKSFDQIARMGAVALSANHVAYIATGWNKGSLLNDFWLYDPQTEKWLPLKNLDGKPRMHATGFVINERIFIGTGVETPDFFEYIP